MSSLIEEINTSKQYHQGKSKHNESVYYHLELPGIRKLYPKNSMRIMEISDSLILEQKLKEIQFKNENKILLENNQQILKEEEQKRNASRKLDSINNMDVGDSNSSNLSLSENDMVMMEHLEENHNTNIKSESDNNWLKTSLEHQTKLDGGFGDSLFVKKIEDMNASVENIEMDDLSRSTDDSNGFLSKRSSLSISQLAPPNSRFPVVNKCLMSIKIAHHILNHAQSVFPSLEKNGDPIYQEILNISDTATIFESNIQLLEIEFENLENGKAPHGTEVRGGIQVFFELIEKNFILLKEKLGELMPLKLKKGGGFMGFFSSSSSRIEKLFQTVKEIHADIRSLIPLLPLLLLFYKQKNDPKLVESFPNEKLTKDTHSEWRESKVHIEPFWYKYHPSLTKLKSVLSVTYTTIGEAQKLPPSVMSHAYSIKTVLECSYQPDVATSRMREIHGDLTIDTLQQIWNLPDYPLIAMLNGVFRLASVAVSQPFEIPGDTEGFNVTCRIVSAKTLPFSFSRFIPAHLQPYKIKTLYKSVSTMKMGSLSSANLSHQNIPSVPVILHFHGGGFVSGSSGMHENYVRDWAIGTNAIIISVDYRLSPKFKFPTAHLECYAVYKWLVTSKDLGFTISHLALVGDSAGGNLAIGVTLKAISESLRIPDGLVVHYPVVDMTISPTASRIIFTNDMLVSTHMLKLCLDAYVTSDTDLRDYLISPLYAPDHLIQKFPTTFVTSCEYDPLSDESFAFVDRLRSQNRLVTHKVYTGVPHGILSLAIPEARLPINDSIIFFKEILKLT